MAPKIRTIVFWKAGTRQMTAAALTLVAAVFLMPALLLRGKVTGRWKRKGRTLTVELFRGLRAGERAAVEEAAQAIWSGVTVLFA